MTMPLLGHPLPANDWWEILPAIGLTSHALGARQGEVKWAEAVPLPGRQALSP